MCQKIPVHDNSADNVETHNMTRQSPGVRWLCRDACSRALHCGRGRNVGVGGWAVRLRQAGNVRLILPPRLLRVLRSRLRSLLWLDVRAAAILLSSSLGLVLDHVCELGLGLCHVGERGRPPVLGI